MSTLFFRHLADADKAAALEAAIAAHNAGQPHPALFPVDPASFAQIPGSPFAYWVSDRVRRLFVELQPFGHEDRLAQVGASSKDDFQFLRLWWEVSPFLILRMSDDSPLDTRRFMDWCIAQSYTSYIWALFAKGGEFSPYFADIHLVINWSSNAGQIEESVIQKYPYLKGDANWVLHRECEYFRHGLTWSRRSQLGISIRCLPKGCIFADKGPSAFMSEDLMPSMLALMNSPAFRHLVHLHMAFGSYEVGVIQRTPVPDLSGPEGQRLGDLALDCVHLKRNPDTANETSHAFVLPALLQVQGTTIEERVNAWGVRVADGEAALACNQAEIDEIAFRLYGIEGEDRRAIESSLGQGGVAERDDAGEAQEDDDEADAAPAADASALAAALVSWAVGCVYGRWDVRLALDPSLAPALQGPFEPLPVCSPGVLVGPDGLPATRAAIASVAWLRARPDAISLPPEGSVAEPSIGQEGYPLAVDWDGILVDDPGHPDDIVRRVRDVLELLWGRPTSERIEDELCRALGVGDLRDYLRNPRRFWDEHVRAYSKSRRKAPIYWLLQSARRNYAVWIYYHRMDRDILYKALANYVSPAVARERFRLEELEARLPEAVAAGGRVRKDAERAVERQKALLAELNAFRSALEQVAYLDLTVDHDDGVLLSIAPLHELVPWRPARQAWEELTEGKYTWSSMSQQLQKKGLVGERRRVRTR